MALNDPVCLYLAASNVEAALLKNALESAGIAAFVVEDVSQVGTWSLGLVSQIHKPEIWVERAQVAAARALIQTLEARAHPLKIHDTESAAAAASATEILFCYHCGAGISPRQEVCPACGRDLGLEESADTQTATTAGEHSDQTPPTLFSEVASWKKTLVFMLLVASAILLIYGWPM